MDGVQVCEGLERIASIMDRALIRSAAGRFEYFKASIPLAYRLRAPADRCLSPRWVLGCELGGGFVIPPFINITMLGRARK